jgi:hypothetical protein
MICTNHDLDYFADEGCPVCKIEAMTEKEFADIFNEILRNAETVCNEAEQYIKIEGLI